MNIVCSAGGIAEDKRPRNGFNKFRQAGFDEIVLDFNMFTGGIALLKKRYEVLEHWREWMQNYMAEAQRQGQLCCKRRGHILFRNNTFRHRRPARKRVLHDKIRRPHQLRHDQPGLQPGALHCSYSHHRSRISDSSSKHLYAIQTAFQGNNSYRCAYPYSHGRAFRSSYRKAQLCGNLRKDNHRNRLQVPHT